MVKLIKSELFNYWCEQHKNLTREKMVEALYCYFLEGAHMDSSKLKESDIDELKSKLKTLVIYFGVKYEKMK